MTFFSFYSLLALISSTNIFFIPSIYPQQIPTLYTLQTLNPPFISSKPPNFFYTAFARLLPSSIINNVTVISPVCFFINNHRSITKVSPIFLQILEELQMLPSYTVKKGSQPLFQVHHISLRSITSDAEMWCLTVRKNSQHILWNKLKNRIINNRQKKLGATLFNLFTINFWENDGG